MDKNIYTEKHVYHYSLSISDSTYLKLDWDKFIDACIVRAGYNPKFFRNSDDVTFHPWDKFGLGGRYFFKGEEVFAVDMEIFDLSETMKKMCHFICKFMKGKIS